MKDNKRSISSMFVEAGLRLQPPIIRDSVSNDLAFLSEFDLTAHGSIRIGGIDASFRSSDFFDAFRTLDSGIDQTAIIDESDHTWQVDRENSDPDCPSMKLSKGGREYVISDLFPISKNPETRINGFKKVSEQVFLSRETKERWERTLKERPATETELEQWNKVVQLTPQSVAKALQREVCEEVQCKIDILIPSHESYFERLVGKYDGSQNIGEYAEGSWKSHCQSVHDWNPYFGFLQNLYSSSHSSVVSQIPTTPIDPKDLERAFRLIEEKGDCFSKLGAIEVGMRIVGNQPEIVGFVCRLIKQIRDDNTESDESLFSVLSTFFEFVDGALSRKGIFRDSPPFYRRIASLAHASLLQCQFHLCNVEVGAIAKWLKQFGNMQFHCQSLTDMRTEPRWIPSFATPEQLKAEFVGRILNASSLHKESIQNTEIFRWVGGDNADSLLKTCNAGRFFLPGPLEGDRQSAPSAPKDFTDAIDAQLRSEQSIPSSFAAFVNGSLLFQLKAPQIDAAAKMLIEGKQRIRKLTRKNELIDILNGLAMASAISESESLRDQVFALVRKYRRDPEFPLTISEAINIFHIASAADHEFHRWCQTLGKWLTEFSLFELTTNESAKLFSYLETLLKIVPELWHHCGRAHAALQSIQKVGN